MLIKAGIQITLLTRERSIKCRFHMFAFSKSIFYGDNSARLKQVLVFGIVAQRRSHTSTSCSQPILSYRGKQNGKHTTHSIHTCENCTQRVLGTASDTWPSLSNLKS